MAVRDADHRTVEANLAANLRQIREDQGLSQDELAQRMVERGFGFSQATIWKIEQGKRPVKISEAVALADAVGFEYWTGLLASPDSGKHHLHLQRPHVQAAEAYAALKAAAAEFLRIQMEMSLYANMARKGGEISERLIERWTSWLTTPGERAVLEARIEDERGDGPVLEIDDEVTRVVQAIRDLGYQPFYDIDGWRSSTDDDPADDDPDGKG